MPQTQSMTPFQSQYTDTGLTCRFASHWCGTSHWNTQLPISMPDPTGESFSDLPHTPANAQLYDTFMVVVRQKLVLEPGSVVFKSITLSARQQLLLNTNQEVFINLIVFLFWMVIFIPVFAKPQITNKMCFLPNLKNWRARTFLIGHVTWVKNLATYPFGSRTLQTNSIFLIHASCDSSDKISIAWRHLSCMTMMTWSVHVFKKKNPDQKILLIDFIVLLHYIIP